MEHVFKILLVSRKILRQPGYVFCMKDSEFDCKINGVNVCFYHNTKTHQYEIVIDYDVFHPYIMTKAKGDALIDFFKIALKINHII